ncbi:NAD(P)-dependent oxidoreductase [Pseudonocardia acaciae]|uniref:NAD(P)-dependent oxidoreductase n=1 Tax=Pseudonocardia acaciae TaxID=551276 RepID=UPI0005640A11|nr:NAD(P)-dependent oxidoreductase [Pseudonocardia acaciae]
MSRVLFVGLGVMGLPMARHVAASGEFELVVHDVDAGRAAEFVAADPVAAAGSADVVVLMLPGSDVVERVLVGDGLLAAVRAGAVIVDMSSSRPASTVALAERAAARGVGYVDAPVSGGQVKAVSGELSIMVGGAAEAVERVRPLLETMGTTIMPTGPVGSGHAVKALNNLLSAIGIAGAAEVLTTGAKFGLDPKVMLDVINASTGRNQATQVKFEPYVLSGTFDAGFALRLMVKDLRTALEIAEDTATPTPVAHAVVEAAAATLAANQDPGADHTLLARWIAANAGVDLHEATQRAAKGA